MPKIGNALIQGHGVIAPIEICKSCNQLEWWGEMRWLSGRCMCRNCYKADYEATHHEVYRWDDLDAGGPRPTKEQYEQYLKYRERY